MSNTKIWDKARSLNLGKEFLENLDSLLTSLESDNKQLIITSVGYCLPTKEEIAINAFKEAIKMYKENNKTDLKGYAFGFIDGAEKMKQTINK